MILFRDRQDAGRALARRLMFYAGRSDVTVLALPRGGVPVALQVAQALNAPLDVFLVRKLGLPGHKELAMGAIASGGVRVLDPVILREYHVSKGEVVRVTAVELKELKRRETAYRAGRPPLDVRGRTVILVDDGLATGSSMRAAVEALAPLSPARVVVAVPVAPHSTVLLLERLTNEVVCLATPEPFLAVGMFYEEFEQISDEQVRDLLACADPPPEADKENSMRNRQVPRTEWYRFFRDFSRRHEDWLVTVRVMNPDLGSQVESSDLPLEGIVADHAGRGPIAIHVGRSPQHHVEHEVPDPRQVWVELSPEGAEEAVEIESEDGTKTIVQFHAASLPREVDGILRP